MSVHWFYVFICTMMINSCVYFVNTASFMISSIWTSVCDIRFCIIRETLTIWMSHSTWATVCVGARWWLVCTEPGAFRGCLVADDHPVAWSSTWSRAYDLHPQKHEEKLAEKLVEFPACSTGHWTLGGTRWHLLRDFIQVQSIGIRFSTKMNVRHVNSNSN